MFWIAMIGTFLVPIYYQARGKGYNAPLITILAAIAHALLSTVFYGTRNPLFLAPMIVVPAAILGVLLFVRPRPGSLGTKISFPCPNSHRTITMSRQQIGLAALCPECKETLTVPETAGPEEPLEVERTKPDISEGPVVYATYADENAAECLASVWVENGVQAEAFSEDSSSVLPPIIAPSSRVVIDAADWERAVEIERSWIKTSTRR
jgi:hypothetical protein